jgi:hypothetical protein
MDVERRALVDVGDLGEDSGALSQDGQGDVDGRTLLRSDHEDLLVHAQLYRGLHDVLLHLCKLELMYMVPYSLPVVLDKPIHTYCVTPLISPL